MSQTKGNVPEAIEEVEEVSDVGELQDGGKTLQTVSDPTGMSPDLSTGELKKADSSV